MTDQTTPQPAARRVDRALGRLATRALALVAFALAALGLLLSWLRWSEFETLGQVLATGAVLFVLFSLGRWLWRVDRPITHLIHE